MITVLLLLSILLYFFYKGEKNANGKIIFFISIILILASGLRNEGVGNDTLAYMKSYELVNNYSWSEILNDFIARYFSPIDSGDKDPGYIMFCKIIHIILPDSRLYLFFIASLLIAALSLFVKDLSHNIITTFFFYSFYITIFYGFLPNSAIRQSLALSAMLVAYYFLKQKRYVLYFLFIVLGSFFHQSALIGLIILPIVLFVKPYNFYIVSFIIFVLSLIFTEQFASLFLSQNDVYNTYLGTTYYNKSGGRPIMIILLYLVLYGVGWLGLKYMKDSQQTRMIIVGAAFSFIFIPLIWVNPSLIRVTAYFFPFMGILVGESLSNIPKGKLYLSIILLAFLIQSYTSGIVYRFMWDKMELHERYGYISPPNHIDEKTVDINVI